MSVECYLSVMTREEQKQETYKHLKLSCIDVINDIGIKDIQVKDIIANAGVARGTFYFHFEDKEAILEDILQDYNRFLVKTLSSILKKFNNHGGRKILEQIADEVITFLETNTVFIHVYLEQMTSGKNVKRVRDGVNPELESMLTIFFVEQGSCDQTTAKLLTHSLMSMWMRVGLQYTLSSNLSRSKAIEAIVKISAGAIKSYVPSLTKYFIN